MKHLRKLVSIAFIIALITLPFATTPVYAGTVDRQINASTDDCYADWTGSEWAFTTSANDLFVGYWNASFFKLRSGMRFTNITIPQGSTITAAYFTVTCTESTSVETVKSWIRGDDVDDAATFSTYADYDGRTATTAFVAWDSIPAWTVESEYDSPSIVTIIQEIVDRDGWSSGNDIAIFWGDMDDRSSHVNFAAKRAYSYDDTPSKAASLYIEYTTAPSVTTSAATNEEETTVTLNANITDLSGNETVYAFFQYGLTTEYGTDTSEQSKTSTGTYSQAIADLSPGTTYHFRAAVKYDTSYAYGSDATFNTKPYVCSGVSATTGTTSVTLRWTKGSGANTTVIRRSTTNFPTTPASGDSVYAGTGVEVVDDTLITNQLYYYSLWSKSSADVYSDDYTTISATPSSDMLSPPDILDIIDVKVVTNYLEYEDNLYVIRYKIIYNAGDPTLDCTNFFNFELLDGTTLLAQVPVRSWGYKPGSIYLSAISAPTWGGSYTIRLRGNDIAWGEPPITMWNLTSGDWLGADLTQLDTWVIATAEALQTYYETEMVIYATTGTVLSEQGGIIFNMGIPGLSIKRPHIFAGSAEFVGATPEEHVIDPGGTMTMDNMGEYLTGLIADAADMVNMETTTFGGLVFGGGYLLIALILGVMLGSAIAGQGIGIPVLLVGAWFGLIPPAVLYVAAIVFILFIVKAIWLRGV